MSSQEVRSEGVRESGDRYKLGSGDPAIREPSAPAPPLARGQSVWATPARAASCAPFSRSPCLLPGFSDAVTVQKQYSLVTVQLSIREDEKASEVRAERDLEIHREES